MTRTGFYVYPAGIGTQVSGLEIKERQTEQEKKDQKGLRGFFVPGGGFFTSAHQALNRATTLEALKAYQLRVFRAGLTV